VVEFAKGKAVGDDGFAARGGVGQDVGGVEELAVAQAAEGALGVRFNQPAAIASLPV
jgi:hypothetical protein